VSYSTKSVLVVVTVAVLSFIIAQLVIPDKNAVTQRDLDRPPPAPRVAAKSPAEEIPVVTADGTPAANPIISPDTGKAVQALTRVIPHAANPEPPSARTLPFPRATETVTVDTKTASPATKVTAVDVKAAPPATTAAAVDKAASQVADAVAAGTKAVSPATKAAAADTKAGPVPVSLTQTSADTVRPRVRKAAASEINVAMAAVCTNVEDRVPKGVANKFPKGTRQISYFTHITGVNDTNTAVVHRWYHEGKLVQTSILRIGSPNWRTHSRRSLVTNPEASGSWKVELVDPKSGKVLESAAFVVE